MGVRIYTLSVDDLVQEECEFPNWINQPKKPNPQSPYWDNDVPPGPLPDPGSYVGGIGSGFPIGMPAPILVFEKPLGDLPFPDVVLHGTRVLTLSGRAKALFESVDASAFEFRVATTKLHDGSEGPEYWLADVTRFLDAIDEVRSEYVRVEEKSVPNVGRRMRGVHVGIGDGTVFKSNVVRNHHIFRPLYLPGKILCDQVAADAIRRQKLRGVFPRPMGVTDAG